MKCLRLSLLSAATPQKPRDGVAKISPQGKGIDDWQKIPRCHPVVGPWVAASRVQVKREHWPAARLSPAVDQI